MSEKQRLLPLDVVATMVEATDATPLSESDGQSLASKVLNGENGKDAQKGKEAVFSEFYGYTMVSDGRYKLVIDAVTETPIEFYDVQTDPEELNNRFEDPEMESVRQMLTDNHLSCIRNLMDVEKFKAGSNELDKVPARTRTA